MPPINLLNIDINSVRTIIILCNNYNLRGSYRQVTMCTFFYTNREKWGILCTVQICIETKGGKINGSNNQRYDNR